MQKAMHQTEVHRFFCVVQEGFEPSLTEPESGVLPLHHWTKLQYEVANLQIILLRYHSTGNKKRYINIFLHKKSIEIC